MGEEKFIEPTTLGVLLRTRRKARGWTQAELAQRAGLTQQAIYLIETAQRPNPGKETLQGLAMALDCTIDQLLEGMTPAAEPTTLGARLRELRKQRNLTQSELAVQSGVDQRYLSDLERGYRDNPGREIIQSLAQALGIPVADLATAVWGGPAYDTHLLAIAEVWGVLTPGDRELVARLVQALARKAT